MPLNSEAAGSVTTGSLELEQEASRSVAAKAIAAKEDAVVVISTVEFFQRGVIHYVKGAKVTRHFPPDERMFSYPRFQELDQ